MSQVFFRDFIQTSDISFVNITPPLFSKLYKIDVMGINDEINSLQD
jgi:hypothetical protein